MINLISLVAILVCLVMYPIQTLNMLAIVYLFKHFSGELTEKKK